MATTLGGFYTQENTADIIPRVTQAIYNRTLLERALPLLLHQKFGQQKPLKKRNGTSMVFRRYESLTKNTAPLTEGVTPSGVDLTKTEIVATIKQYGNFTTVTDLLDMAGFDDTINEASQLLGENMGESMDTVYREILNAGTSYVRCDASDLDNTDSTRLLVDTVFTKTTLDVAINILDTNNAKKFTSMVSPTDKVSTFPIAASYWCIIHPDIEQELYKTGSTLTLGEDFTPVERYSAQTQVMPSEVGKYRSIRFVSTTESKIFTGQGAAGVDVYSMLIFAKNAYGIVPLEGGSTRTIIHRAGSNVDPLNQRNTIAWKAASTAIILNDDYMVRIECALA